MKRLILLFVLMLVFSCTEYIDKPNNFVDKGKMAEILADLAINDQAIFTYQNINLEAATRYVLKSHNVKPNDFVKSFEYYVMKQQMKDIAQKAQGVLLKKDPKANKYVKDKLKSGNNLPNLER